MITSFKGRMMEQFTVLAEEYTEQFKRLEKKYMELQES